MRVHFNLTDSNSYWVRITLSSLGINTGASLLACFWLHLLAREATHLRTHSFLNSTSADFPDSILTVWSLRAACLQGGACVCLQEVAGAMLADATSIPIILINQWNNPGTIHYGDRKIVHTTSAYVHVIFRIRGFASMADYCMCTTIFLFHTEKIAAYIIAIITKTTLAIALSKKNWKKSRVFC